MRRVFLLGEFKWVCVVVVRVGGMLGGGRRWGVRRLGSMVGVLLGWGRRSSSSCSRDEDGLRERTYCDSFHVWHSE